MHITFLAPLFCWALRKAIWFIVGLLCNRIRDSALLETNVYCFFIYMYLHMPWKSSYRAVHGNLVDSHIDCSCFFLWFPCIISRQRMQFRCQLKYVSSLCLHFAHKHCTSYATSQNRNSYSSWEFFSLAPFILFCRVRAWHQAIWLLWLQWKLLTNSYTQLATNNGYIKTKTKQNTFFSSMCSLGKVVSLSSSVQYSLYRTHEENERKKTTKK